VDRNDDGSVPITPLRRFEEFVSTILTVTKDDIQKVEDQATDIVRPRERELDQDAT